jgi:hypothetical protein
MAMLLALAVLLCAAAPVAAQAPPATRVAAQEPPAAAPAKAPAKAKPTRAKRERFHIHGLGNIPASSWDLSEDRKFQEFREEGHIRSEYTAGTKPGYEAGVQFDILPRWGLAAALSGHNRDASATYDADLPHPLFLDRDRKVSGELSGLAYRETLAHFDLVHTIPGSRLDISLFAGTTRASVSSELIRTVEYRHEYPYDTATVTATPTIKPRATAFGFNAGAALSYRMRKHFALMAQGRFAQAKIRLLPVPDQPLNLDAGGLAAALGLRIGF